MSNKLNGLSLTQTNILIDSLNYYKNKITIVYKEQQTDFDYLLSQLNSIKTYLEQQK